jgi:hypothetical protein
MKTTSASLLVALFLAMTTQLSAQKNITVEAANEDISYALDLRAVASVFGESKNLEEFEQKLNDNDNEISNLDLNNDGYIDYLRVIETSENDVHLVVIQAILGDDFYQDVATIVVEKNQENRFYVQVVGDPFIYGYNYIIEPYFTRTPFIINWFWSPRYYHWNSPYYWGYYPHHYRYRSPVHIDIYLGHIHNRIDFNNRYRYAHNWRNDNVVRLRNPIARNDYGRKYPEKDFTKRNHDEGIRNKHDFGSRYDGDRNNHSNDWKMNDSKSTNSNRNSYGSRNTESRNNNDNRQINRYDQNNERYNHNSNNQGNNDRNINKKNEINRENKSDNRNTRNNVERPVIKKENTPSRVDVKTRSNEASNKKKSETTNNNNSKSKTTKDNNTKNNSRR